MPKLLHRIPGKAYPRALSASVRLGLVASIDATAAGTTVLYTVPVGEAVVVTSVRLYCTTATGITVPATAGVGIAAGEEDIFLSRSLYGLTAAGTEVVFSLTSGIIRVALAGEAIKLGIDQGAAGTSQTLTASIFGYTT